MNPSLTCSFLSVFFITFYPLCQAISLPVNEESKSNTNILQDGIVRSYVAGALLSSSEEITVLEIAKKRGIGKVHKIITYTMLPSSAKAIRVEGPAMKKGREVLRKFLNITHREWTFPEAQPGKNDLIVGNFWAGKVYVKKQVELYVSGESYLCNSVTGMTLKEAEVLLAMFLSKRFMASAMIRQNALDQVDWCQPTRFTKQGDRFSVGFLAKGRGAGFFDLTLKKENEGLTILQMKQAVP